jgi:hypothetical protein
MSPVHITVSASSRSGFRSLDSRARPSRSPSSALVTGTERTPTRPHERLRASGLPGESLRSLRSANRAMVEGDSHRARRFRCQRCCHPPGAAPPTRHQRCPRASHQLGDVLTAEAPLPTSTEPRIGHTSARGRRMPRRPLGDLATVRSAPDRGRPRGARGPGSASAWPVLPERAIATAVDAAVPSRRLRLTPH